MPCRIIVGGQYGSEGKGKVTALRALSVESPLVVRCGGPNSGHTVEIGNRTVVLRQIPSGVVNPNAMLLVSAGCVVDEALLAAEVNELSIAPDRIVIDPRAVLTCPADHDAEKSIVQTIGSTASGTGRALARRMSRADGVRLAGDSEVLRSIARIERVAPLIHAALDLHRDVIVEGTQGFALSLLHAPEYPFLTSRDTTAAGFASEVGISPRQVESVEMVIRTFPIRVGGNSGPLSNEITWEDVRTASSAPNTVPEYTSVTRRLRRVAHFDLMAVQEACRYNHPTLLAVMGVDRLDYRNTHASAADELTELAVTFLNRLTDATHVRVDLVGTGFGMRDVIRLGKT